MTLFQKAWLLLKREQKKYVIFMFALMFIAMFLESSSVGIIIPLISILLEGDIDTSFFSYFFIFGKPTENNLIYMALLITVIIYWTYFTLILNKQYRFSLVFLPYLAILAAYGITSTLKFLKNN